MMAKEYDLSKVTERLNTQDNRVTQDPLFCAQERVKDVGYDRMYAEGTDWINMESGDYEETEPHAEGAKEIGYKWRWKTVMVSFTEGACKDYLMANGHHHIGETRIYAMSLWRCSEMIAIRKYLMELKTVTDAKA
jgi:hypothetical protein